MHICNGQDQGKWMNRRAFCKLGQSTEIKFITSDSATQKYFLNFLIEVCWHFFLLKVKTFYKIILVHIITLYKDCKVFWENFDYVTFSLLCPFCLSFLSFQRSEQLISGKIVKICFFFFLNWIHTIRLNHLEWFSVNGGNKRRFHFDARVIQMEVSVSLANGTKKTHRNQQNTKF